MPQKNKNTYSKPKFLIAFAITVAVLASLQAIFQFDVPPYPIVMEEAMGDTDIVDSLDYAEEVIEDELLAEQATTIPEDTRIEEKQDSVKEEEIAKADSINKQIDSFGIGPHGDPFFPFFSGILNHGRLITQPYQLQVYTGVFLLHSDQFCRYCLIN